MNIQITKIEIKNFRSIRSLSLSSSGITVFVGKNDCGKSNILRALNLFFNGFTNPKKPLAFAVDHNVFNKPNRRAKEITISLEISLPETYHDTNGEVLVWKKRWRQEGLEEDNYVGKRRRPGPRGGVKFEDVTIPAKSNLHMLLRNINYVYVPAIKDLEYFAELRASIYNVIAESATETFRKSSQSFELSISEHLKDLTDSISKTLGFTSRLALPRDLSHVFESLDFLSDRQDISLDARGDGIKARHIPMILKFMADKKRPLQVQGAAPYNFIWGYEEPENNLELASCVELADQFWRFLDDGISQTFLSTHSPVFYNLQHKNEHDEKRIVCHHIFYDDEENGTEAISHPKDLDEQMGTMTLFAPLVRDLEDRMRAETEARVEAEQLAAAGRRKLFVEGPPDKLIIERALQVFAPDKAPHIDVETKDSGGGCNYVIDMLKVWRGNAKHNSNMPKAAGLIDKDKGTEKALSSLNGEPGQTKSAKCFTLSTPPHLQPALQAGFKVPIVLESMYDRKTWKWAEEHHRLKQRILADIIPKELNQHIIDDKDKLCNHLDDAWSIFVLKEFSQAGKLPMAKHFAQMEEEQFRERLGSLESLVTGIIKYLFLS